MKKYFLLTTLLTVALRLSATVVIDYNFNTLPQGMTLHNSARLVEMTDGNNVLALGYDNGYAELGEQFAANVVAPLDGNFTISIDLLVDAADNALTQDGNFVWCFASQSPNSNPANYVMMRAKNGALGYTMRPERTNYRLETNGHITTGEWQNLTYVHEGNVARLYLNGAVIAEKTYAANENEWWAEKYITPAALYNMAGSLPHCCIGRSAWSGDAYLRGAIIDNFCIEDRACSADEIAQNYAETALFSTTMKSEYEEHDPTKQLNYYDAQDVRTLVERVNDAYQSAHAYNRRSFWDYAVYHTGNMEAWQLLKKQQYFDYSVNWGRHNSWQGSKGDDPTQWKYGYGEGDNYALFGDWQCCFQTYIDIYNADESGDFGEEREQIVARAKYVMNYMMQSDTIDYWWWADALYMAMPVMTKMWMLTGDDSYLDKLDQCFAYSKDLMYSDEENLFFRDANYIYPQHKTSHDKPDFWSRGNGWVVAGLAKVLTDLPEDNSHRDIYERVYKDMCKAIVPCQHSEGYWTESLQDSLFARCRESSGTCLFTFGLLRGVNNGILSESEYMPTIEKAWNYLTQIALQRNWTVGYMQPIGAAANENAQLYPSNVTNFGTGAFLLAASEMVRYLERKTDTGINVVPTGGTNADAPTTVTTGIYAPTGEQLSAPQRGINIINGKKIVVK